MSRKDMKQALASALSVAFIGFVVCAVMIYNGRSGLDAKYSMHDLTELYETSMLDGDAGAALKVGDLSSCILTSFFQELRTQNIAD
jgi:hypothetical protein